MYEFKSSSFFMLSEMSFNSKWPKRQWLMSSPSTYVIKLCPFNLSEPEVCDSFPVLKYLLQWTWPVASSLQHHPLLQGCCGQLCTVRTLSWRRRKGRSHYIQTPWGRAISSNQYCLLICTKVCYRLAEPMPLSVLIISPLYPVTQ